MKMGQAGSLLDGLNDEQKAAVTQTEGPVMIIAGAGSGKTRVLTHRIAQLLEQGVDPFNILALTFTNKAAREMRERIEKMVGPEARNLWMGTFHSVFSRILRVEGELIGYPKNFVIYDSDDSKSLIKTILKEMNLSDKVYKPNMVLSRISNAKNSLITAKAYELNSEYKAFDESTGRPFIAQIFSKYTERCFRAGAMDFDDLLLNTFRLFKQHLNVLNKYQHLFKYVMIDEYQDTNHCQYMIIKKLAAVNENICVVGDDAQSIYAFRGATIRNILNFEKDYPDHKVFKLEQNYRSSQTIVKASSSIIKNNQEQLDKSIWTQNPDGDKIKLIRAVTDNEEARFIAQSIFEDKMHRQLKDSDFAILYRTNAQSRSLEEALRKQNIPYRIYGGMSFYQRKEIKDMIAYLRLTINHKDEEALKRIINYPARGIGKTTMERVMVHASNHNCSLWDIVTNAHSFGDLSSARAKLEQFATMIKSFATMIDTHDAYEVAMTIARSTTLLKTLNNDKTVEGISRYENLAELLNGIKEFIEDDTSELEKDLPTYLQDIALLTDQDRGEEDQDCVSLMTIHMSKGLEFPNVFISGLEENLFPSQMSMGSRQELEEERRLFYVAVTRAEKKLTLSFATSRFHFGNLMPCEPSRFLDEVDPELIEMDQRAQRKMEQEQKARRASGDRFIDGNVRLKNNLSKKGVVKPKPTPQAIPGFVPEDISDLKAGEKIQHQRFGNGVVTQIEGGGDNKKATVSFDEFGEKKLVLKFAKLRRL